MARAPEFSSGNWLNGQPLSLARLRGRVVLLYFWNATCLDCLRDLPALDRWQERYAAQGLTIIGVHTPEFAFGREQTQVEWAIRELGVRFPVLLDNEYKLWNAYGNELWPSYFLIDQDGMIRFQNDSANAELERSIQTLLREIDPTADLPSVRAEDPLPRGFLEPTAELFGGIQGGALGNPEGYAGIAPILYPMPDQRGIGAFYVSGAWQASHEYIAYRGTTEGMVQVPYEAVEVNAVLSPHHDTVERMLHPEPLSVEIWQDDLPLTDDQRGADVTEDGRLLLDRPRVYNLIRNPGFERHELSLRVHRRGFTLYRFSFVGGVRRKAMG